MDEKKFDFLVLGGDEHGVVFVGPYRDNIEITTGSKRMGKSYAPHVPADLTMPVRTYPVREYKSPNGNSYYIASSCPLSDFDVDAEIKKARISPMR